MQEKHPLLSIYTDIPRSNLGINTGNDPDLNHNFGPIVLVSGIRVVHNIYTATAVAKSKRKHFI